MHVIRGQVSEYAVIAADPIVSAIQTIQTLSKLSMSSSRGATTQASCFMTAPCHTQFILHPPTYTADDRTAASTSPAQNAMHITCTTSRQVLL